MMARRKNQYAKSAPKRKHAPAAPSTRQKILDAAGQVFAEKGFSAATGKEICELAGVNAAAVNYHFGGVDALYTAVLHEARNRLVTTEAVVAAVAGRLTAEAKLEALVTLLVRGVCKPARSSWAIRVLGREIVTPSAPAEAFWKDKTMTTRFQILRSIVSELTGMPENHPIVTRGCVSVMGPMLMLLVYDRQLLRRIFPHFGFQPKDAPSIVRQFVQHALGGLAAVAAEVKQQGRAQDRAEEASEATGFGHDGP
jgi:TetR/AcrR family transcriptional regulator, regulator of cefoperazone and chloramphenicol sensitivity